VPGRLAFLRDYRAAYREASLRLGRYRAAPVTWTYLAVTLAISFLWHIPGTSRVVTDCCAFRATDLRGLPEATRLLGSSFVDLRNIEIAWSSVASWLLLAPLEALIGSRRLLLLGAVGTLLPTAIMSLIFMARSPGAPAPLDIGTSAVVVAVGAALSVWTRSLPITLIYLFGVSIDVLVSPDLATAEHLLALVIGAFMGLAMRRRPPRDRSESPRAEALLSTNHR
jgi:membrane associated rhomboid family serine protease